MVSRLLWICVCVSVLCSGLEAAQATKDPWTATKRLLARMPDAKRACGNIRFAPYIGSDEISKYVNSWKDKAPIILKINIPTPSQVFRGASKFENLSKYANDSQMAIYVNNVEDGAVVYLHDKLTQAYVTGIIGITLMAKSGKAIKHTAFSGLNDITKLGKQVAALQWKVGTQLANEDGYSWSDVYNMYKFIKAKLSIYNGDIVIAVQTALLKKNSFAKLAWLSDITNFPIMFMGVTASDKNDISFMRSLLKQKTKSNFSVNLQDLTFVDYSEKMDFVSASDLPATYKALREDRINLKDIKMDPKSASNLLGERAVVLLHAAKVVGKIDVAIKSLEVTFELFKYINKQCQSSSAPITQFKLVIQGKSNKITLRIKGTDMLIQHGTNKTIMKKLTRTALGCMQIRVDIEVNQTVTSVKYSDSCAKTVTQYGKADKFTIPYEGLKKIDAPSVQASLEDSCKYYSVAIQRVEYTNYKSDKKGKVEDSKTNAHVLRPNVLAILASSLLAIVIAVGAEW